MHMADSLVSPAVAGVMWAGSAGLIAYSARQVRKISDTAVVPLMGVAGAFVFTAQMINFTIPGVGSSGHIAGTLLLSIFLGPYAAFLSIASILVLQGLFFADGGLLAMGCNIFNIGFWGCFVGYDLVYKRIVGATPSPRRIVAGCIVASVVGLQLGAFSVVIETLLSGMTAVPFGSFVLLMQPIHLAIGLVEGLITAVAALYVFKARPEIMALAAGHVKTLEGAPVRAVLVGLALTTLIAGGILSRQASSHPDGLEWSLEKVAPEESPAVRQSDVHQTFGALSERAALFPEYDFKHGGDGALGVSVSGIVGGAMAFLAIAAIGWGLVRNGASRRSRRP